eukprot:TRINITY_DN2470_c0_g1_i1.p1 TRINITY_DN2470_c0_g1~~TRINITY_DN2470_c0_g1_i1.p1  ORF type:complete len:576 (-),score=91.22 TRINITY_DN2470_c0_g1_i1:215-1942(-)
MYGWINDCVEALVLENFGEASWKAIKEKAGVYEKNGEFIRHKYYDDASTYSLVFAAAEVLNLTPEQILETFGGYFVLFVKKAGYDKLMRAQGSDLYEFLSNMNSMHFTLQTSGLEQLEPPDFACERVPGCPDDLILHYWSTRKGLAPMIPGIVKQCAKDYFKASVEFEPYNTQPVPVGNKQLQYTKYYLKKCGISIRTSDAPTSMAVGSLANSSGESFSSFPFHIAFTNELRVLHLGHRLMALGIMPGDSLLDHCSVIYPRGAELNTLRLVSNSFIKLRFSNLILHGGVMLFPDGLIFLGNPDVDDLSGLLSLNLTLADIPIHDSYRKSLFQGERIRAELQSAKRMEEANVELSKEASKKMKVNMADRTRVAIMQLTAWSIAFSLLECYDLITDWLSFREIQSNSPNEWQSLVIPLAIFTSLGTIFSLVFLLKRLKGIVKNIMMLISGQIEVSNSIFAETIDDEDLILSSQALRLKQLISSSLYSVATAFIEDIPLFVISMIALSRKGVVSYESPVFISLLVSIVMIGARISQGLYMTNYKLVVAEVEHMIDKRRITRTVVMQKQAGAVCPLDIQ